MSKIVSAAGIDRWGNGIRHGTDGTDDEGFCFTVRIIVMSFIYLL
jgi:hypothetical protein